MADLPRKGSLPDKPLPTKPQSTRLPNDAIAGAGTGGGGGGSAGGGGGGGGGAGAGLTAAKKSSSKGNLQDLLGVNPGKMKLLSYVAI